MDDILSQTEIDTLINKMTNGESHSSNNNQENTHLAVKQYNFRKPNKFTKDQLRTLYMINENFSRILSNFLSGYLRSTINIKIATVEQITYEEFMVSISTPTLLTSFQMTPLNGAAVIEFGHNFTSPAIDLLFGGVGRNTNKPKELTEIELRVLRKLIEKVLENMALAWSDVFQFSPKIESMDTNPKYNQIISPNETIAIITFTAAIAGNKSIINLCLPYATLKETIPNLTAQNWFAAQQYSDISQAKTIENRLGMVLVDLDACCGETMLTVQEFLHLDQGDVVLLNRIVGEDMELMIQGHPKLKFQPGIVRNHLAVLITGKL